MVCLLYMGMGDGDCLLKVDEIRLGPGWGEEERMVATGEGDCRRNTDTGDCD